MSFPPVHGLPWTTLTVIASAVATLPLESVTRALSVWLPAGVLPTVQLSVYGDEVTGLPSG